MQVHHIEGGTSRKCCPPRLTAATISTGETDLQAVWSFEQGQAGFDPQWPILIFACEGTLSSPIR